MKSVKTMLLGIAFLVLGAIGTPLWMAGSYFGCGVAIVGTLFGILLCLKGYLNKEE